MTVMIVAATACTSRSVADGDAESGSSGNAEATTDALASSTSTSTSTSTSSGDADASTTEPASSDSSESTAVDDGCPPASKDVAWVSSINLAEAWVWPERSGIATATCDALAYEDGALTLSCVQDDGPLDPVDVLVIGDGLPVTDALASVVGMQELRLAIAYGPGFFPGFVLQPEFTLRSSEDELLILRSATWGGPGVAVADVARGWAAPFTGLRTVDHGCAFGPGEPDAYPGSKQPFALELETDDGPATVFNREQATVSVAGVAYEVSVERAVVYETVCGDCPPRETWFSIVRHAPR